MRNGTSNSRRQRGRSGGGNGGGNNGRRGGNQRMQVFDSNGPDVRIRGTANQVHEKYLTLAKDAASSGDRIIAESYLQHAEHYQRIINSWAADVQGEGQKDGGRKKHDGAQDKATQKPAEKSQVSEKSSVDDLALPSSILGASSDVSKADAGVECTSDAMAE